MFFLIGGLAFTICHICLIRPIGPIRPIKQIGLISPIGPISLIAANRLKSKAGQGAMQKVTFYLPKGHLLHAKKPPFAAQKTAFRITADKKGRCGTKPQHPEKIMMKPKSIYSHIGDFHPSVLSLELVAGGDDYANLVVVSRVDKTYTPCVLAGSHVSKAD